MNWILLVSGALFLVGVGLGIYQGAIRIAVSLAATIVTLLLVVFLTPVVGNAICKHTPLDNAIEEQVTKVITQAVQSRFTGETEESGLTADNVRMAMNAAGISEDDLAAVGVTVEGIVNGEVTSEQLEALGVSSSLFDGLQAGEIKISDDILNTEISRDTQISAIQSAEIPEVFKNLLLTNNNGEIYKKLGAENFAQYVAKYLAKLVINIVAFLLLFIVITIIIRAIIYALDVVTSLPVLGFVNRVAGALVGGACALVIIWFAFVVITLLFPTEIGGEMMGLINGDETLKFVYDNNPILKLATNWK